MYRNHAEEEEEEGQKEEVLSLGLQYKIYIEDLHFPIWFSTDSVIPVSENKPEVEGRGKGKKEEV